MEIVSGFAPDPGPEQLDRILLDTQDYFHSLGIVGWQDAIVGEYLSMPDPLGSYVRTARSGGLRSWVTGALWWDRSRGPEQIDEFRELRGMHLGEHVRFDAVKIMQDGICENCTGAMLRPYERHGEAAERNGDSLISPRELDGIVTALDAAGFSVHFHGVGDRAVRECLDAVEVARERNGHHDLRHQIAHVDVVDPRDVPRFAALGVTANLQPLWARADKEILERVEHPVAKVTARTRPVEIRHVERLLLGPAEPGPSTQSVWMRIPRELPDDPLLHAAIMAYASDYTLLEPILRRHGIGWGDPRLRPASLDHSMWFHRPGRFDDWVLYTQSSPSAQSGRGLGLGHMYAADGTLLATVGQEGMVRIKDGGTAPPSAV